MKKWIALLSLSFIAFNTKAQNSTEKLLADIEEEIGKATCACLTPMAEELSEVTVHFLNTVQDYGPSAIEKIASFSEEDQITLSGDLQVIGESMQTEGGPCMEKALSGLEEKYKDREEELEASDIDIDQMMFSVMQKLAKSEDCDKAGKILMIAMLARDN
jgi:hypothetical protein